MTLSINPTYLCNFRCSFCYLSKEQLSDRKIVDTSVLIQRLTEISTFKNISHVDLYGGEISLLSEDQFFEILAAIKVFYSGKINIITNFYKTPSFLFRDDIELSVSWDYKARERFEIVYKNMLQSTKDIHILMLASNELLRLNEPEICKIIEMLNKVPMLQTLEIKPYSHSFFNSEANNFKAYENFVQKWINYLNKMKFEFINVSKIKGCLTKDYSSWSDNHLYIQPNGDFAVLDFDNEGREYFKSLDSISEYELWCKMEKEKISSNSFCKSCKYLGHCLSEHLQEVKNIENSCNGFFNLIEQNKNLIELSVQ